MKSEPQTKGNMAESGPVLTRIFDAPRERVWKAWTEPEQAKRWHGPKGYTATVVEIDLRVGGKYLTSMRSPEGKDHWGAGVYREIAPMDRLVFTHVTGKVVPDAHYGRIADIPLEELVILTFEDLDGKTRMTLQHGSAPQAWNQTLDKLAASVAEG